jgi:quercetin dioxygenase-like cupin family protein
MKTFRVSDLPRVPQESAIFTGPVTMQDVVGPGMSERFLVRQVNFAPGVRNKLHTHTIDQVLIVTAGTGLVATEDQTVTVTPGDVVFIPAGEKHWHGATASSDFSHLYVMSPESKTTQIED